MIMDDDWIARLVDEQLSHAPEPRMYACGVCHTTWTAVIGECRCGGCSRCPGCGRAAA